MIAPLLGPPVLFIKMWNPEFEAKYSNTFDLSCWGFEKSATI